jgi:hypothetical protein
MTGRMSGGFAVLPVALLVSAMWVLIVVQTASGQGEDRIDTPANGAPVSGAVEIRGRATGPDVSRFSFYRILIGVGRSPSAMRPLGPPHDQPVEDGVLATWDTDQFPSGEYTLVLMVYDKDQKNTTAQAVVYIADKATPTPVRSADGPIIFLTPVEVAPAAPAAIPPPDSDSGPLPVELPPAEIDSESPPPLLPIAPAAPAPAPIAPIPADTGPLEPLPPSPPVDDIPPLPELPAPPGLPELPGTGNPDLR